MDEKEIGKVTSELRKKYPDAGIKKIEVAGDGSASFYLEPTKQNLATIDASKAVIPRKFKERSSTISRDAIDRSVLDLGKPKDAYEETPEENYKRVIRYYYTDPLLGSVTNMLANMSCKGFENDIDDANIKQFYDTWTFDVNFEEILEWIYLDFFKTGHVTTYKVLSKYEPRVSYLSPIPGKKIGNGKTKKATGAKKKIWSKGHLPVSYTVLNPLLVTIDGNLLFDKVSTKLKPPPELTQLLKKSTSDQTDAEKLLIKSLPSDLKAAAEKGGDYQLDERLVGSITYRKQPYERYARPRATKVFDAIEYKRALEQADLSTLDGISNYILKITIGSDEFPVSSQAELDAVAELFNTPSKSFDVVWNHTLSIEKIVSPEIEAILGKEKYQQVNEDMTVGLGVSRSMIDGVGSLSIAEAGLITKGLTEEINYARRQVTRWIYREYQQIAEAVGFDRFPKIRWDESVLKDTILYMNTLSQLVDRRMLSYRTSLESLGFDYDNELENMENEVKLVKKGTFGILGSPWQQAKSQPVQKAPVGTPSSGRPPAQPAGPKGQDVKKNQQNVTKKINKTKTPQNQKKSASLTDVVKDMDSEQFNGFIGELLKIRSEEE